jgi:hypothetical protein
MSVGRFACVECGNHFELRTEYGWDGARKPEPHVGPGFAVCMGRTVPDSDPGYAAAKAKWRASTPQERERARSVLQGAIDRASEDFDRKGRPS